MAEVELNIKTKVETGEAQNSVENLSDKFDKLIELQEKNFKESQKGFKETKKGLQEASKATDGLKKGFQGVGLAIKAAGIGLLISSLLTLKEVFQQNSEVAKAVSVGFEAVSIVFNKIVNSLVDAVKTTSQTTNGFKALGKVVTSIINIALSPLQLIFFGIKLAIQESQLAWEKSFLGDKDPKTIKNLNKSIAETKLNILEIGESVIDSSISLVDNFGSALTEVNKLTSSTVDNLSKISVSAAIDAAKTNVQLKESAELAAVQIQGLIEKYDREAEVLRQIRDDDTKSISERIKANNELGIVLQKSLNEQLKLAQVRVDAAQAELDKDKQKIESQVALQEALNEVAAIQAQVTGFESEQLINKNALLKEQKQVIEELALIGKDEEERAILEAEQERERRLQQAELFIQDEQAKKDTLIAIESQYQNQLDSIKEKSAKVTEQTTKAEIAAQNNKLQAFASAIGALGQLFEKGSAASKAAALTEIAIGTGVGFVKGLQIAQQSAAATGPGAAFAFPIFYGTQIAAVLGAASKAKAILSSGGSGSSGGSASVSTPNISTDSASSGSFDNQSNNIPSFDFGNQGVGGNQESALNRNVVILQEIKNAEVIDDLIKDKEKIA